MSDIVLIVGNDKIGRKLIHKIESARYNISIYIDKSPVFSRVMKLLLKRSIKLAHLIKMFFAELVRQDFKIKRYPYVSSNGDILRLINNERPKIIYFFRAAIIVNKSVIDTGVKLINVHSASLPKYGGLAAIARALENKDYMQSATMHLITEKIDSGDIIRQKDYELKKNEPYWKNENIAYDAGIDTLLDEISKKIYI